MWNLTMCARGGGRETGLFFFSSHPFFLYLIWTLHFLILDLDTAILLTNWSVPYDSYRQKHIPFVDLNLKIQPLGGFGGPLQLWIPSTGILDYLALEFLSGLLLDLV